MKKVYMVVDVDRLKLNSNACFMLCLVSKNPCFFFLNMWLQRHFIHGSRYLSCMLNVVQCTMHHEQPIDPACILYELTKGRGHNTTWHEPSSSIISLGGTFAAYTPCCTLWYNFHSFILIHSFLQSSIIIVQKINSPLCPTRTCTLECISFVLFCCDAMRCSVVLLCCVVYSKECAMIQTGRKNNGIFCMSVCGNKKWINQPIIINLLRQTQTTINNNKYRWMSGGRS